MPARALKRVVLPVFGLPSRATVSVRGEEATGTAVSSRGGFMTSPGSVSPSSRHPDAEPGRLIAAQAEAVVAQPNFQRIAQRRDADDFHFRAFEEAHLQESLHQCVTAHDRFDGRPLADAQLVEGTQLIA